MRINFKLSFLMLWCLILMGTSANAQVSALPFAQSTNTYVPITGGSVLGTTTSDDQRFVDPAVPGGGFADTGNGLPIGFNFNFNGRSYDRFAVNANGWMSLGQSSSSPSVNINSSSSYQALSASSAAPAALQDRFAGFSFDLSGNGFNSEIRYQTIGTAPNRVCVIQFKNWTDWGSNYADLNFQFRLYELGGIVEIHYGVNSAMGANLTPQVGLRGDVASDFSNRTTTSNWAATTAGATNTATCTFNTGSFPANGTVLRWGNYSNDDAGVIALNTPGLPLTPGNQPVQVEIQNFGANNVTTAAVQWSVGGVVQAPASYAGLLISGGTAPVNLGIYNFPPTPTIYKFWTSMPNGVADTYNSNDTIEVLLCAGLNGSYTVGTLSSDFPTVQDMMDALYSCGVGGPVTMNIQGGTHNGYMHFDGPILGASATNTVTINGAAGWANTIITHDGTGANGNAVVAFNGVSYITVQNLTLQNTGTNDSWGALFTNNATYNNLMNNRIDMYHTTNVFDVIGVVFAASFTNDFQEGNNGSFNLVQGNDITGGEMGIHVEGSSAQRNKYNRFIDNTIHGADDYGMYIDDQDSLEIIGNKIYDLQTATFNYGIYCFDIMDFDISRNQITAYTYGVYISDGNFDATPQRRGKFVNNMIQFYNTYGVYFSDVRETDFYHNTIEGTNPTSTTNSCMYIFTPQDLNIRNNIFVNQGGYVFRSAVASPFTSMDYNLFYQRTTGFNFISFGGTVFNSFAQWQANTFSHGASDVYGDPVFYTATDLHTDGYPANDAGDNTVGVLVDIDGEARPFTGSTQVDIGADEYSPKLNDAGVIALANPMAPLQSGTVQPVTVTVKNFAVDPLNLVTFQWMYNGTMQGQFTQPFSTALASQATQDVTIATVNLPANQPACFDVWTTLPNGVVDERPINDTFSVCLCPGLNGTFTLGLPTSDFPTFQEAIDAAYECGISGPVTFLVQPGTYMGQQLAIDGGPIAGASNVNRITFDGGSPSLVTLTHDASGGKNATVLFDNASYVTAKNMTIETTASSGGDGWGVHFINGSSYCSVENNVITATYTPNIFDVTPVIASSSYTDDFTEGNSANYCTVEGNTIRGGEMGVHFEGSFSLGELHGMRIINNDIGEFDDYGIYLDEMDSIEIIGNTVDGFNGSTQSRGIYAFDLLNYSIEKNIIKGRDWGMYLSNANSPSFIDRGRIFNNFIVSNNDDAFYGVTVRSSDIWNNTFAHVSTSTFSGLNGAYLSNTSDLDIRNNIFSTTGTSTAAYCLESASSGAFFPALENNVYYKGTGTNIIRYSPTIYANFTNWQTTNAFGYDQNSLNVDPQFVNAATGDLHIQNIALNTAGDSTVMVMDDIDMETRPSVGTTRPDIGADEILVVNNDAIAVGVIAPAQGACESAFQTVTVEVGNSGLASITAMNVQVNITGPNGPAALSGSYSGTLLTGQTANVNVGTMNTTGGGQFCFEIITQLTGDGNPANDTTNVCVNVAATVPTLTPDTTCINQPAVITSTPAGGITWYSTSVGGAVLSTADTFVTPPLLFTTTYYAEVTACGTTRYPVLATVVIPQPISIGPDTTICTTGQAVMTVPVTGQTYAWSTGETTQTVVAQAAGAYSVTMTDATGCNISDTRNIANFPATSSFGTGNTVVCGNDATGTIDLSINTGTAPFTYLWSTGATTEDISGLNSGAYNVTITDGNACATYETVNVNGPAPISFNAINAYSLSCGALLDGVVDIDVVGGTMPYNFLWSTGATTEDISGLTNGTYSVTITDAAGCTTNTSTTLNASGSISISVDSIQDETTQLGGAITVSANGGQAPLYIIWNTGQTTSTISGLPAGQYVVTVYDANGCSTQDTITVNYAVPSSIDQVGPVNSLKVFPNPTRDLVNIQLDLNTATEVRLDIFSVSGQLLRSFTPVSSLQQNYQVDLSPYAGGVYMARLIIGDKVVTTRIILQK